MEDTTEDLRLYAIARQVTDAECGPGTYARSNHPWFTSAADAGDVLLASEEPSDSAG
jgi:hypothetical protein